jgi:hypothetical protein
MTPGITKPANIRVATKLALLTGGVLTLMASAGARAQTVYITEPAPYAAGPGYAAPGYPYAAPGYAYEAYAYGAPVVTGRTIVTGPGIAVVPETRTIVVQQPPAYLVERPPGFVAAPRFYGERRTYVAPGNGLVGVEYSAPASCSVDINGFERCY